MWFVMEIVFVCVILVAKAVIYWLKIIYWEFLLKNCTFLDLYLIDYRVSSIRLRLKVLHWPQNLPELYSLRILVKELVESVPSGGSADDEAGAVAMGSDGSAVGAVE